MSVSALSYTVVVLLWWILTAESSSADNCQSMTVSYKLSSEKCLEDGWTVRSSARSLFHCTSHSLLELDQPLYKVNVLLYMHRSHPIIHLVLFLVDFHILTTCYVANTVQYIIKCYYIPQFLLCLVCFSFITVNDLRLNRIWFSTILHLLSWLCFKQSFKLSWKSDVKLNAEMKYQCAYVHSTSSLVLLEESGPTFSKLLRKIFGRFLILGKS